MLDLTEEWADLLRRRPALAESLTVHGELIELWARAPDDVIPLAWSAPQCSALWERGVPLLAEAPPALDPETVEPVLGGAMELLAAVDGGRSAALQRLAQAWDRGAVRPHDFFPAEGRIGAPSLVEALGLDRDALAFLAAAGLRPALQLYFAAARSHLGDGVWFLGVCPFCGAPPGFADLAEGGQRRLVCHLCGADWAFARLRCPLCGNETSSDFTRLDPGDREEGYAIVACKRCRGYVKELDRRLRWNGRSALIEDWGSPHFDLVARRAGYWRPIPSLVDLAAAADTLPRSGA